MFSPLASASAWRFSVGDLLMSIVPRPEGPTAISLGMLGMLGTLELGLQMPFLPLPMGFTDGNGDVSRTIHVPAGLQHSMDLFAQAFTASLDFQPGMPPTIALTFCTSGVEAFHIGN